MNKEFFKSILLTGLILLSVVMTKNLLDSKTPEAIIGTTIDIAIDKNIPNIERIIYPQDFVIGFGGGSYTGVYSEETRENIWKIVTNLIPAYLEQQGLVNLDLVVIEREEFLAVEKTRSVQMQLPFAISLNDLGDVYGINHSDGDLFDTLINKVTISTSQQDRVYFSNSTNDYHYYIRGQSDDKRLSQIINRLSNDSFTEYRRVDSLINFKSINEDEVQVFLNGEIIPITSIMDIPFIKVTKEIDARVDRQNSEIKNLLNKAFGNSTDFIKRLEEIDGSQTYIYGYGDKTLRLSIDGKITYQEKLQSKADTKPVSFKEGLYIAYETVQDYGNTPQSLYLSAYKTEDDGPYEIRTYYFDYRIKDLNVYTKNMGKGHAIEVIITDDVVTKFTKNIRKYVKSIDTREIWNNGPMFVDTLINENFAVISRNFNEDNDVNFSDREANWQMSTYVLSIMQDLKNVELYYYLDPELDDERLIPSWRVDIGNTRYYFHVYTGDVLSAEKIEKPKAVEVTRR